MNFYDKELEKIKGKKFKNIKIGFGGDFILEFEDGTEAEIEIFHYLDGTISNILIEITRKR